MTLKELVDCSSFWEFVSPQSLKQISDKFIMHSPCESSKVFATVCCNTGKQLYLRQSMDTSGVVYLFLFVYYKWQQCTEILYHSTLRQPDGL
jgi:hypothetical protein